MVSSHEATDDFTRKIQEAVDYVHMDEEARIKYMTIGMKIMEERNDALKQGIEQGIKQGIEQGITSLLITQVKDGEITIESAAKHLNITTEEFEKLLQK